MTELDRILSDAVGADQVPFAVATTGNSAGVTWSGAAGEARAGVPASVDADGKPRLCAPRTQATVRHLATHTSGLVHECWNADVPRRMEATGLATILSGSTDSAATRSSSRSA